jgi:hypothetical protein
MRCNVFDMDLDGVFDEFLNELTGDRVKITIGQEPDTMTVEGTVVRPGDPVKFDVTP